MKRRSFLKIIGLAVAAPSSLAGVASGVDAAKWTFDIVPVWPIVRPDLAVRLMSQPRNPAYILADLMINKDYGLGDERPIDWDSFDSTARILEV